MMCRVKLWIGTLAAATLSWLVFQADSAFAKSRESTPSQYQLTRRVPAEKPIRTLIYPNASISHVVVKFRDELEVRLKQGKLSSKVGASVEAAESVLSAYLPPDFRRLFGSFPPDKLDRDRDLLQYHSGQALADLNGYYRIEVSSPSEAERIVNRLNALDIVEIAYFQPVPELAGDIDPPTPDFQPYQDYREAAPDGVDAEYVNTLPGGDGSGVKIVDIEGNWRMTHEDLDKALGGLLGGELVDDPGWRNHGTAVIGEMIAGDNQYGVTGICPGADIGMVSVGNMSTAEAIYTAIDNLQAGDLILIELHAPGPHYDFQQRIDQLGYVCMEYWQANYDATRYAWAKGITVVEAGGNGWENLDDTGIYGRLFDTTYRNSHAIIVGAGYPASSVNNLAREGYSNHGTRVNLQGYGSGVYTTGYGRLFDGDGDEDQYYTSSFSGTSSASPIVAGAAACLQGYYRAAFGATLTSDLIRDVLVTTGTPQLGDTSKHIGPRPDLRAAITALAPPPSIYTNPTYLDTTVEEGTIATAVLWMINRSFTDQIYYRIDDNDSLAKGLHHDWLIATPQTGVVPAADSVRIDVMFDATVIGQRVEKYAGVIEISWGHGPGWLDSTTLVPAFLTIPCNDRSYDALSSDDPGGPTFHWISAKDLGVKINDAAFYGSGADPLDDGTTGPWPLGFSFLFYSAIYNSVHIGVNGAISFTDASLNVNGFFSDMSIPGAPFETFIAPFWNDLIFNVALAPDAGIYYYTTATRDTTVIEWYGAAGFSAPNDTLVNFEIVLSDDGNILFQYNDVGNAGLEQSALIGISEVGCHTLSYFDGGDIPANMVSDSEAVHFESHLVWMQSGNIDGVDGINIADLLYLVEFMFNDGPAPVITESADVNCSGGVDVADLLYLADFQFNFGPGPCYFSLIVD